MVTRSKALASASSTDAELAAEFCPRLRLSGPGTIGVNLRDDNYPYSDYIPFKVNDPATNSSLPIKLYTALPITYNGTDYSAGSSIPLSNGDVESIGDPLTSGAQNYLDFSPLWAGLFPTVESGYKSLTHHPTVYYKVSKDLSRQNPIAIQYWFFYFYNDWTTNHPGDWESVTVFLDYLYQPAEVAFSTHYEANRFSWSNVEKINDTHPVVYISNGGHGSYKESGNTVYTLSFFTDNHLGEKEILDGWSGGYTLSNIASSEAAEDGWVWFDGRWGDGSHAPRGPRLRTDAPTSSDRNNANNPPYDVLNSCQERLATRIYGKSEYYGPWNWAAGYGLDSPWQTQSSCTPQTIRQGFNTYTLNANDDGSTSSIDLGFTANFFGSERTTVFVNNNGNITFDAVQSTYTPYDLTTTGREIIAPFLRTWTPEHRAWSRMAPARSTAETPLVSTGSMWGITAPKIRCSTASSSF